MKGVAQHQGYRENGAQRIGDALTCDVGRRSMNRFVEADRASDAGRSQQAERSHDSTCLIGQDVAEHVFGEDDVELGGLEDERHGGRVHVHVRELDIGKISGDASDDFAPETRALQNIRLIDGEQMQAAGASKLKCDAGDGLDLRLTVAHGVERVARAARAINGAWLAEIQSAEQLAHDEDVGAFDDFFAQRRGGSQRRIKDCGPKICEGSEFLAEAQQSSFGAKFARIVIEGWTADCSEQYRLGGEASLNGRVRHGISELFEGHSPDLFFVEFEIVVKGGGHFFQNANGLGGNFRTNSVAGEGSDTELHGLSFVSERIKG